ncbi:hypothetical protein NUW54_g4092 [Trametes sanguinea]|uniref:Uncharacterized protein n=1 Tax=Trametes sanguinea TaxID=158606 RepID=A0ACC1Q1Q1_9APHY|nr:hypothetical protein NUW54_g4092 [Trametes sanguinea]
MPSPTLLTTPSSASKPWFETIPTSSALGGRPRRKRVRWATPLESVTPAAEGTCALGDLQYPNTDEETDELRDDTPGSPFRTPPTPSPTVSPLRLVWFEVPDGVARAPACFLLRAARTSSMRLRLRALRKARSHRSVSCSAPQSDHNGLCRAL